MIFLPSCGSTRTQKKFEGEIMKIREDQTHLDYWYWRAMEYRQSVTDLNKRIKQLEKEKNEAS